jgi:hypothetical protein
MNYLTPQGTPTPRSFLLPQIFGSVTSAANSPATNVTPANLIPATTPLPMGGTGQTAPGTLAPIPVTVGSGTIPIDQWGPPSFLDTTTWSKADVSLLKSTVDGFAAAYTSGSDAAKDSAAVAGLSSGLKALSIQLWSENHILSKDELASFQKSVDDFVSSYTGGTNLTQDVTAWSSLKSGLQSFMQAAFNPQGTANAGTSTTGPGVATTGVMMPGPMMPGPLPPSIGSPLVMELENLTPTDTTPMSAQDLATLQQSVDTFADAYTSGADAAKDKAALSSLQSSLDKLAQSHWASTIPAPPIAVTPFTTAQVTTSIPAPPIAAMPLTTAQVTTTGAPMQGASASGVASSTSAAPMQGASASGVASSTSDAPSGTS